MLYTKDTVLKAIEKVFPESMKNVETHSSVPTIFGKLQLIAEDYFIKSNILSDFSPTDEEKEAYNICAESMKEMIKYGYVKYADSVPVK